MCVTAVCLASWQQTSAANEIVPDFRFVGDKLDSESEISVIRLRSVVSVVSRLSSSLPVLSLAILRFIVLL